MSKNTKRPFFKGLRKSSGGGGSGSGSVALSPEPSPPLPRSRSPFSLFRRHHDTPTSASAPSSAASFVSTTSVVSPVLAIPTTLPTTPTPATPPTLVIPDPQIVVNNSIAPLPCAWEETIEIAKKKLHDHGLPDLCESPGLRADQIIQLAIGDLETAIVQKNSAGVLRIQNVLKTIDGYAKIVDTAIQHSPEVTSLVWAGARAMLQIALNHIEITEALEAATALIAEKMAICEFYASVYEETRRSRIDISSAAATKLQRTLDSSLPELYAAVLVFSVKGHQYFSSSTSRVTKWKLLLKPYSMEFKPFIDDILEKEKRVRECADLATMDTIKSMQLSDTFLY
ncbi:hypothetical protein DFH27DRAFT_386729 [Peziza echinospora]|nr:hypothetical protein DFH27DRAFT_386729 [Peziza echinospora]